MVTNIIDIQTQIDQLSSTCRVKEYHNIGTKRDLFLSVETYVTYKNIDMDIHVGLIINKSSSIPIILDLTHKIPYYFHRYQYGDLCVGVGQEIKEDIKDKKIALNLVYLLKEWIIPYYYSYRIYKKTGKMPFGERSHGIEGLIEAREDMLVKNIISTAC